MKTPVTTQAAAMLRVSLPSTVFLPADADLNALFRVLGRGQVVDMVYRKSDGSYSADYYHYTEGQALPKVEKATDTIYLSRQEAQAACDAEPIKEKAAS